MTPRMLAGAATALLFAVASQASAFCLAHTCDPTQEQCETDDEDCVTSGVPLRWPSECVTFDVQVNGSPRSGIDATATAAAVEAAFAAWLSADCGGVGPSLAVGTHGLVACDESRFNQTGRNANIVMFRDVTWPYPGAADTFGMTMLRYNKDTGELWDADVEINSADFAINVAADADHVDLQSILTHELGHFLGLAHPGPNHLDATMSPRWDGKGTSLRTIETDDAAGLCALYPPGRSSTKTCGPINGFSGACFEPVQTLPKGCASIAAPGNAGSGLPFASALVALAYVRRRAKRHARRRAKPPRLAPGPPWRLRTLEFVRAPAVGFVLRFVAIAAPLLLLYAYPYSADTFMNGFFERFLSGYAHAAGTLLEQVDPSVSVTANQISGRFPLAIVRDCDAMQVNILFVSAVAAFPSRIGRRLVGAGVGLALLVLANLSRIVSLYFIGVESPGSFEFAHREVWPLVLIAVALGIFFAFTRWEQRDHHGEPPPFPA